MSNKHFIHFVLSVVIGVFLLSSCNLGQTQVYEITESQRRNDEYVKKISEDSSYKSSDFGGASENKYYYKVIESAPESNSDQRAYQNSRVLVEYSLALAYTGQEIDQKTETELTIFEERADRFVEQVLGLQYALQEMRVGDRWELIIPWQLGYGPYNSRGIPPYSTLKYDIKLLKVTKP